MENKLDEAALSEHLTTSSTWFLPNTEDADEIPLILVIKEFPPINCKCIYGSIK